MTVTIRTPGFDGSTYQTIPWAPDPMGLRFWYRFRMVNLVSPTSTV